MSDAARFKAFEAAGWSERAATFETLVARATGEAIEPLLDAVGVHAGTRVLDVGCGLGTLAAAAAARGARATGVDLAEGMLEEARRRHPALELVLGDVEDLPFGEGSFEAVTAAFVVNHLADPERGAAELARVARPGGRVGLAMWGPLDEVALLGLPTAAATAAGLDEHAIPVGPSGERFTDTGELTGLLSGAGLADVTLREIAFTLHAADFDELWAGVLGGTVRASTRLATASPEARERARAELERLAERHRAGDGYELPTTIRIAAGRRPRL
jgi:SAM-dependent methyltransferase